MDTRIKNISLATYNCKNVIRLSDCVRKLCRVADIIALQETWLLPHDVAYLGQLHTDFAYTGKSAVDTSAGVLIGRPYGGFALLWRKSAFSKVSVLSCNSDRITSIKIEHADRSLLVISDSGINLIEFTACLSHIIAISENSVKESVYVLGDFNAHPLISQTNFQPFVCSKRGHVLTWNCYQRILIRLRVLLMVTDAQRSKLAIGYEFDDSLKT
ncbi:unnamed protein product [Leptidea sinapis]|uniref:Endonuclease/exonuclease/phosphatase domain-containing protein n=1 Tax=Leptidea sinapis TaxID=189913 RepID=A0A5E4QNE9_9NEOP|nr:unnamed protein product [Leptidea sinapis]